MNDAMKKMLADIEESSARTNERLREFLPSENVHVFAGDSMWRKRIPRTENRVADLAGFLRWADSNDITAADIEYVVENVFTDLTVGEIEQAKQLA